MAIGRIAAILSLCLACGGKSETGGGESGGTVGASTGGGGSGAVGASTSGGGSGAGGGEISVEPCVPDPPNADDEEVCRMNQQLTLSSPSVRDADGDGRVEPGEAVEIGAVLSNSGPLDHYWYPGIRFSCDRLELDVLNQWNGGYALFAWDSQRVDVSLTVPSDLQPGTVLQFSLVAGSFDAERRCCGAATSSASFSVTLE